MEFDLRKTAALSRLELPCDTDLLEKQMNDILDMISVISRAQDMGTEDDNKRVVLREDIAAQDQMPPGEIFENAPEHENGYFCVPAMVK